MPFDHEAHAPGGSEKHRAVVWNLNGPNAPGDRVKLSKRKSNDDDHFHLVQVEALLFQVYNTSGEKELDIKKKKTKFTPTASGPSGENVMHKT